MSDGEQNRVTTPVGVVSRWREKLRFRAPFDVKLRGRDFKIRVGFTYPWPTWMQVNTGARLHFGWDQESELPGVHAWLTLAWLHFYMHIGGGWTDEDGENRTFLTFGAYLKTYGLRYIGCWFGHKPSRDEYGTRYFITCDRCNAALEDGTTSDGGQAVASQNEGW